MASTQNVTVSVIHPSPPWRDGVRAALRRAGFVPKVDTPEARTDVVLARLDSEEYTKMVTEVDAVVAIVQSDSADEYQRAFATGAAGVLNENAETAEAVTAVRNTLAGQVRVPIKVLRHMSVTATTPIPNGTVLTELDLSLLRALVRGETLATIADEIGFSTRSTQRQLNSTLQRIGARNRSEAIAKATKWGLA